MPTLLGLDLSLTASAAAAGPANVIDRSRGRRSTLRRHIVNRNVHRALALLGILNPPTAPQDQPGNKNNHVPHDWLKVAPLKRRVNWVHSDTPGQ